jgi:hypothetical protein
MKSGAELGDRMVTGEDNGFTEAIAPVYLGVEPVNGKLLG